jgi:hypothetical protein
MHYKRIYLSDYIYDESDRPEKTHNTFSSETTFEIPRTFGETRPVSDSGFPYRTLQKMRQTGMQVLERKRTWTKILPRAQCVQKQAGCNLRAFGSNRKGKRLPGTISNSRRHAQANLRYQSGASETRRIDVGNSNGYLYAVLESCSETGSGHPGRQYDRAVFAQCHKSIFIRGDIR